MYKRAKKLEGNTGKKLYSLNPREQSRISDEVKALLVQQNELDEKFTKNEINFTEYQEQTAEMPKNLKTYEGQDIHF